MTTPADYLAMAERLRGYAADAYDHGLHLVPIAPGRLTTIAALLEQAAKDAERLDYVLPIVSGDESEIATKRALALGAALMLGKDGLDAIDAAMQAEEGKR